MILWHLGVGAMLTYVTLGRRRIDYRFILLGAFLPDTIDALISLPEEQSLGHTLLAPLTVAVVVVIALRGERRLAVFGLAVGWLTHLVLDAMWQAPETFLWPAFGTGFDAAGSEPYSWDLFTDPGGNLLTWAGEVVGFLALAWLWVAHRLGEEGRVGLFLRDGYLRP